LVDKPWPKWSSSLVLASVILRKDSEPGPETGVCAIVVLYEDNSSRDAAISLCNSLQQIFSSELDFEITWCRFKYFNDPGVAAEAAERAAQANVVLVSVSRAQDLPLEVKAWFERWLCERKTSEGALVLLQGSEPEPAFAISQSSYLYLVAQRANLEFISLSNATPSASTRSIPDPSLLAHPPRLNSNRSSRWGINE
jgi:hypothetical protein